jgi:hypothetical protein
MRKWIAATLLLSIPCLLPLAEAGKKAKKSDADDPKEALQAVQEFIGGWKGQASSKKGQFWKEGSNWGWRFKGKDVFLTVEMDNGQLFKKGELRFLPDKEKYQLTLADKAGMKRVYEGELKKNVLVVERTDPDSGDTEQVKLATAGGGDRLVYTFLVRPEGRTMYNQTYQVAMTKEGVTFGTEAGSKKPECIVTGGLGTMQVSFMGQSYYVCCSGCRDAFNENPAKMIAEYKAKKKKGG